MSPYETESLIFEMTVREGIALYIALKDEEKDDNLVVLYHKVSSMLSVYEMKEHLIRKGYLECRFPVGDDLHECGIRVTTIQALMDHYIAVHHRDGLETVPSIIRSWYPPNLLLDMYARQVPDLKWGE